MWLLRASLPPGQLENAIQRNSTCRSQGGRVSPNPGSGRLGFGEPWRRQCWARQTNLANWSMGDNYTLTEWRKLLKILSLGFRPVPFLTYRAHWIMPPGNLNSDDPELRTNTAASVIQKWLHNQPVIITEHLSACIACLAIAYIEGPEQSPLNSRTVNKLPRIRITF